MRETSNQTYCIEEAPLHWAIRYGGKHMLLPTIKMIEAKLAQLKIGEVITLSQLGAWLAADTRSAKFTCPITLWHLVRKTALRAEKSNLNAQQPTPWWRIIKDGGLLLRNFPGGKERQALLLEMEGHTIAHKIGKDWAVTDFDQPTVVETLENIAG